jgi:hypothetical protein
MRLEGTLPDDHYRERVTTLLDFDQNVSDSIRARELEAMVLEYCLPWLDTVSTVEGARIFMNSHRERHGLVTKDARAFLAGSRIGV